MAAKILWVTKGLGPGGAETLLVEMARAGVGSGAEITCAYVLPWKDHLCGALERVGVTTTCLSRRRRDIVWPWHLVRLVRRGAWNVVHTHSPLPGAVARLAACTIRRSRRPTVVVTEHNSWATFHPLTRLLARWTTSLSDVQFAVTDEVAQSVRGGARSTVTTLRHGIDLAVTDVDRRQRRAELGVFGDECLVVTVANLREQKDYPNLLAAAALLVAQGVNARVVCVGQGPLLEQMVERRDALGLAGTVEFLGYRADTRHILAAADVFVLASRWEGLPVAVMEACGAGLALVLTRVGGIAEQVADDEALLVPAGDPQALAAAIASLATDADRRHRLAQQAKLAAARFDIRPAVETTRRAYALGASPPDAATATASNSSAAPRSPQRRPKATIRPASLADRPAIIELLGRSLGGDDPRLAELFAWKHETNPFGASPLWIAERDGRIAGVRAMMRWDFERGGQIVRAVRAVDTATDPDFQGQGIFRALTMHAVDACRDEGIDWVFNTPNSSSRPGYLTMGWRVVGRLPAAMVPVNLGGLLRALRSRQPAQRWSVPIDGVGTTIDDWLTRRAPALPDSPSDVRQIRTHRTESYLRWRYGQPLLGYRVISDDEATIIVRARQRGASVELVIDETLGDAGAALRLGRQTAAAVGAGHGLVLGPVAAGGWRHGVIPIPGSGPMLTWRALRSEGLPPLPNWDLSLGDIELF